MSTLKQLFRASRSGVALAAGLLALVQVAVTGHAQEAVETDTEASDETDWALVHRRFNSREGGSGGLALVDPGSGAVGSLRLQLLLESFPGDDFLHQGDEVAQSARGLSASWTALANLELYAALQDRGTSYEEPEATSLHAQSAAFGAKLWTQLGKGVTAGGGLRFDLHNGAGEQSPTLRATSVAVRGAAALDFRDLASGLPLIGRLNLDYLFDNSAAAVEDIEDARYAELDYALSPADDTRQLLTRSERYAFGINRVDTFGLGLGFEAPIGIAERTSLHPLLEWRAGIPVNRQGFDCAVVRDTDETGSPTDTEDACLGSSNASAWAMTLTAGLRVVPPVRGVSLALAIDFGLTGTSSFVHELAPNSPFMITLALGYDYDARPESSRSAHAVDAVAAQREPVAAQPQPVAAQPQPAAAQPAPVASQPAVTEAAPPSVALPPAEGSFAVSAEPVAAEPSAPADPQSANPPATPASSAEPAAAALP